MTHEDQHKSRKQCKQIHKHTNIHYQFLTSLYEIQVNELFCGCKYISHLGFGCQVVKINKAIEI